ncbi:MAG: type II secretion system F family protein [Phycisphaerae bacterium]|nr:type II secretion system F family protein [Phycisphaerae bacterium]
MPWFEYEGLTPGRTAIAGRIEAGDRDQANENLDQMQIQVNTLSEQAGPSRRTAPLSEDDLIFFNQQLASLAEAGIALDDGLAQLARDVDSHRLRKWLEDIVADLRRGVSLDEAVAARERGLPILYSRVIRAGIQSGELPATLLNLNQHLRLAGATRRMTWEIVSYPLIVATLALAIQSAFYVFVVPQFREIYADFGTALPVLTKLMLAVADHYTTIMLVLGAAVGLMVLAWFASRYTPAGLAVRESIVLVVPIIGRVYRASLIARFLRSVSTAVATGIPLPQAMRLAADATGSRLLVDDAARLASEVEQGQSIFAANQSARVIPPLFGFCVQAAVGRDALPTAVGQLARSYENRAIHTQSMLRVVLFPALVILLGGFLAFAILAMFLPLVTVVNCVSGG